jgi:tetratricopeptide (TPR) repeat protein
MRRAVVILLAILGGALSACGSTPPPPPEEVEQAAQWNQRGRKAFQAGDYERALGDYEKALALQRSLENLEGVAVELINIASVHRARREPALAHRALDAILSEDSLPFADHSRAEAATRKALLFLEADDATQAGAWLDRAQSLCRSDACRANGVILNLRARLALSRQDAAQASGYAQKALAENRRTDDRAEQANSLRLAAEAAVAQGDCRGARPHYEQALALDKETAAAPRILADLLGLARCAAREGRIAEARSYFKRAVSVAEGLGDTGIAQSISREMSALR